MRWRRVHRTAGEDAFLLGPYMVGVADGVGSWWEADIDPAIFARGLMEAASTTCISMRKGAGYEALRRPQQVWPRPAHGKRRRGGTVAIVRRHSRVASPHSYVPGRASPVACRRSELPWIHHGMPPSVTPPLRVCLWRARSRRVPPRPSKRAQVLHEAWRAMQRMGTIGSATACLVALHPMKSELLAANVGDSGFIIIRRSAAACAPPGGC